MDRRNEKQKTGRTEKVDPRALIARLNRESAGLREREIIAPLLRGGRIRTRVGQMVYEFKPKSNFVGWGHFRPLNDHEAEVLGEALPWQRAAYLELFPALRVILLWPATNRSKALSPQSSVLAASAHPTGCSPQSSLVWWALPFNESDARQRFGLSGAEPLPILLCDPMGGAQAFERVIARVDGKTLWFDGPDLTADPIHAEWLREAAAQTEPTEQFLPGLAGSERLALLFSQIRAVELAQNEAELVALRQRSQQEQQVWLREQAGRSRLENRLRHALSKAEATLHSYSETINPDGTPGHLVVEWSERGQTYRYRSVLNRHLSVVSSGICLSGRDNDFDLTSLVSVMTDPNAD